MIKGVLDWPSYENPKLSPLRESEFQIFDEPEPCLESYDSSIEEEDEGVELYTKVQEVTQVHERLKPFYESFDPEPTDYKQRISYYLYYSALYVIFIYTRPDIARPEVTDSDEELKEKAFGIHYFSIFNKFMDLMTNLSIDFYASLEKYIRKHSGADHPLLAFMQVMNNHKEMHSRRLKGVPDSQRSKEDNGVVYNSVTGQEYQYDLWKEARTKKIREDERDDWLKVFQKEKRDVRHQHSIWQEIQAKNIFSMEVLEQKIEYIHQNPVSKKWKLAADRANYPYSSAGYYDYGKKPVIEITDINEWLTLTPPPRTAEGA